MTSPMPRPMHHRVAERSIGLVALCAACTPSLDPSWVLARTSELALRIEVVAQGPYGDTLDPQAPTTNEVLPLDTVLARPLIVGPDGVVPLQDLSPQWYLCDGNGNCLLRAEPTALPPCDLELLAPDEPCALVGADSLEFKLGDFLPAEDADAVFLINRAPTIGFVASAEVGPGTAACIDRISERKSLEGCLWMERTLSLGSLAEVVDALTALGSEFEVSDSLAPLLDVPRNHNPAVTAFSVSIDGGEPETYPPKAIVTVPVGATIAVAYLPNESDVDRYTVEVDGEELDVEDHLQGRWLMSREVAQLEQALGQTSMVWEASRADPVTAYFVVHDDRRAEAWGWLHFEPQ